MNSLKHKIIMGLLLISSSIYAQQEMIITNYNEHLNIFNPAKISVDSKTKVIASFRRQWAGIKDAPSSEIVSFGTSLNSNIGLGVSIVNYSNFVEKQTITSIDFSYKLKLTENTDIYLGLKAGGNFYRLNSAGLETYNIVVDPTLENLSKFNPNIGAGFYLTHKRLYFGASVPRILNTDAAANDMGRTILAVSKPHLYTVLGYDIPLSGNEELVLKPSIFTRMVKGAPISADFNTMLAFHQKFEIGGMYRTDEAYAGIANLILNKRFTVGYVYESSTRKTLASARNTSEILLKFIF